MLGQRLTSALAPEVFDQAANSLLRDCPLIEPHGNGFTHVACFGVMNA